MAWNYGRFENWVVNKSSATLFFGSYIHLIAGATLLALIFLSILAALLLTNADLYLNSNRAGYLGLACIPFLFAFTGKNSIISYLTGISHHRLNKVHRFLGLSLFILISVHMGCMFHVWWPWKELLAQQMATERVRYGIAAYTTLCLIVILAAWPVRRWAYEVFVTSHTLFLVFLVLISLHTPYAMRFVVAGAFVYALNVLAGWCIKTHMGLAIATVYQGRLTRVSIAKPIKSLPGQHIYICVPSMSLIQWHPFTISTNDNESITIHARAVGGYTRELALWPESEQRRILIAGPYGEGVQVGYRPSVEKVVFLAAGSGLSYILPILTELLERRQGCMLAKARCIPIEVIWCIRDQDEVAWFQEELEECLDRAHGLLELRGGNNDKEAIDLLSSPSKCVNRHNHNLRLVFHYTTLANSLDTPRTSMQASHIPHGQPQSFSRQESRLPFAGDERVEWVNARLNVSDCIQRTVREIPGDSEIDIVGCGPSILLSELHNAVAKADSLRGCRINIHTERFHL
ncbi:hypothetical protein BGW41_004991 [Actinomortierella wolfii]|nr:hypothetical protein BGW41_004991 [Actinomortierella wolfii]